MIAHEEFSKLKKPSAKWLDFTASDLWGIVQVHALAAYAQSLQTTTLIDNNARLEGARAMLATLDALGRPVKEPAAPMKSLKTEQG